MKNTPFPAMPAIHGVRLATTSAGFYDHARDDVLALCFPERARAGGVFTRSEMRSADIDWCRHALSAGGGEASALIVNAGNSNAFTGAAGIAKNRATIDATVRLQSCPPETVFVSSTGVIGEPVRPAMLADVLPAIWDMPSQPDWEKAARAIMTTDTYAKGAHGRARVAGTEAVIIGIAKGSGMIAPNMATMLVYLFTDAPLSARVCQSLVARHAETSFNAISVDGDCSTSDTLLLFATGEPAYTDPDHADLHDFSCALAALMEDLAIQIVRDGEGATALIEIVVTGSASNSSARAIAGAIACSPLVKTAMAARDPNWGRIIAAAGAAGEPVVRDACVLHIGATQIARAGARSPDHSEAAAQQAMHEDPIRIRFDAGCSGNGTARMWTCDLTAEYVAINGAYRS